MALVSAACSTRMVRADGYVKVLDFGLAKLTEIQPSGDPDPAKTQAGATMGTLAYMSPEQATGEPIDHRTDIWSLGVVLYELVTGQKPFGGENRQATVNAILSSEPQSATASDPHLPSELHLILDKALEKDRDLRYQTASDFRADLRRLLRVIDSTASASHPRGIKLRRNGIVAPRWLLLAAASLVLVLGALVAWSLFRSKPQSLDWSRAIHVQLTDQAGTEFFPSLTPDGKSFVYASKTNGNFDLFLQRVGGRNVTLLTKDSPANDTQPAFSPDGTRIAFRSDREPAGVYLMEATGENVRPLAKGGFHPAWSPDGKEIVYSLAGFDIPSVRNTTTSALRIVNVESGASRLLTSSDAMQPAWSPHGDRIAFWFMPRGVGRSDVATISKDGGEPVVVTKDAVTNWNPVWSPGGKFLYFASDRSGNMSFWRVPVDEHTGKVSGEPEAVITPSTISRHLGFSRDGKRMIYVQTDERSNVAAVGFDSKSEKLVGNPFWITSGSRTVVRPELSPDQKRFVMRLPRRTQDDLAVVNRDGTNWRDLTNDKFFDRYPRWSPDGKTIAFASDRSGNYEIWTIDVETTSLKQITFDSPPSTSFPIWSPDGKKLLFRRDAVTLIIDVGKSWGEQTPQALPALGNPDSHFIVWDWSPDGRKLAGTFGGAQTGLGYFSFDTQRYEQIADFSSQPYWLPNSRRFVFANEGKAFIADTISKIVRELPIHEPEQIRSIVVSKDGRLLYYTASSSESDIWLLDLESR